MMMVMEVRIRDEYTDYSYTGRFYKGGGGSCMNTDIPGEGRT